jgi:hypothetical protein
MAKKKKDSKNRENTSVARGGAVRNSESITMMPSKKMKSEATPLNSEPKKLTIESITISSCFCYCIIVSKIFQSFF